LGEKVKKKNWGKNNTNKLGNKNIEKISFGDKINI
jgi:hypothetical protein